MIDIHNNEAVKKLFENSFSEAEQVKFKKLDLKLGVADTKRKIKELKQQSKIIQELAAKLLLAITTSGLSPYLAEPFTKLLINNLSPVCAILELDYNKLKGDNSLYLDYLYFLALMLEHIDSLAEKDIKFQKETKINVKKKK